MSATEAAADGSCEEGRNSGFAVEENEEATFGNTPTSPLSELDEEGVRDEWSSQRDEGNREGVKVEDGVSTQTLANSDTTTPTTLRPDPPPSVKRRESEVGIYTPEASDKPNNKKRKRGSSPPWHFPTAGSTSLKTADGRRISARFNSHTPAVSDDNDGAGARARSSSLSTPPQSLSIGPTSAGRSRPPSPPWKKFGAEGPTTVVVDGKRKSGRVNKELSDPPKRVSPRSKQRPVSAGKGAQSERKAAALPPPKKAAPSSSSSMAGDNASKIASLRAQIEALKPTRSFPSPEQPAKRSHKRKPSSSLSQLDGPTSPTRAKHPRPPPPESSFRPSPKIKLRLTHHARRAIPPPHPHAKPPSPSLPPTLSIFQRIEHYELKELQAPYTENERGPPDAVWFASRASRLAVEEAGMRKRLLAEAQEGGMLSPEKLGLYQDNEAQREPAKQFGHIDHLVAHALHLRHLQQREKVQHRLLAKKVAHEALEFWKLKKGPTEEDLALEAEKVVKLVYRQVVADVKAKWELVAGHVQQRRLQRWEADEEVKRQERLREKLQWSERMVERLRGEGDGDEEEEGSEDGDSESEEENMSESSSEADGEEEGGGGGELGEDELAAYLAQREAEPPDQGDDELVHDVEAMDSGQDEKEEDDAEDNDMAEELHAEAEEDGDRSELHDVSMADLFADDAQMADNEEVDEEFELGVEANDDASVVDAVVDMKHSLRRSRRSSMSPSHGHEGADADNEAEVDFSSDESTDMDSTDYDSDDDMSATDEEGNDAEDEDEDGDEGSGDERSVPTNSLLSLFKDEVKKYAGLPTPTTSAEGDEREGMGEEQIVEREDAQADAGPVAEDTAILAAKDEPGPVSEAPTHSPYAEAEETNLPTSAPSSPSAESTFDAKQLVPSPALLRGTLRTYQHAGLDWLASLYRNGTNGILADEMGLGKTIQTIALLGHLAEEHSVWDCHLVIVPTSVILNWVTEFQKFLPGFRVLGYYGTAEERQQKRRGWVNDPHHEVREKRGYNVVVTSYNVAMQDINAIRNVQWHYLVLDEAHNIRNFNSQRWQVLIRLKTRARLLLTGTPLQNSLTELWSLLTFLTAGDDDPQHGDLEEFLSHWKEPVREIFDRGVLTLSSEAQKVVDQLHISLRPFLLRRLKSEVEKDLPTKTEHVVVCKLSKRQRQLYQEYMGLAETRKSLTQGNAVSAGRVLLSLRRVCNHPDLFDPRPVQTSWGMEYPVAEGFAGMEGCVRRLLGGRKGVPRSLCVVGHESLRMRAVKRSKQLSATARLETELRDEEARFSNDTEPYTSTLAGCQALQKLRLRQQKLEHLRSAIRTSQENLQLTPIYGSDLRELLTLRTGKSYRVVAKDMRGRVLARPLRGWPKLGRYPLRFEMDHVADWMLSQSSLLQQSVQTAEMYAERLHDTIVRFAFCTPAVIAPVLDYAIPLRAQQVLRASSNYPQDSDYANESRTRTAIAFPDSRLLIYDSGKLQRLTLLLRDLQARGSRSLIFTQMTGTLNILERFLSLLNLPYLRLDGSTPVERRQLYSAEFNRTDSKYQCMILSSRAGGIGLNLVGASSVIFYDLDWNPQMDRQCMDRAHRIGQVRDVEVFKMVSEKTVEENILRRAEQKSLLDQTVIQEGRFTTEYQQTKQTTAQGEGDDDDVAVAIERFLGGGNEKATAQAIESVEDREDVQAAQQARKEEVHQDEADFEADRSSKGPSVAPPTPGHGGEAADDIGDEGRKGHVDYYMIRQMERLLEGVPFIPPPVRKDRHGRDPGHRAKRKR